jgi:hypothetical protein
LVLILYKEVFGQLLVIILSSDVHSFNYFLVYSSICIFIYTLNDNDFLSLIRHFTQTLNYKSNIKLPLGGRNKSLISGEQMSVDV